RFAAESERPYLEQVLIVEFGRGVAFDGERKIGLRHAAAIVCDGDLSAATAVGEDIDPACAGVDRGFDKVLDHARGTVNHFTGSDPVDDLFGELADGHRV